MGYINPLLELPAGRELQALPEMTGSASPACCASCARRPTTRPKRHGHAARPMAAYWRAVATYARHTAHALKGSDTSRRTADPRRQHLRVPVFPEEKELIEANAKRAVSVARYLRDVGQGYQIKGVMDYEYVRELVRVNGDLGRLGGLLKLWLTDDPRTARFGDATILALLGRSKPPGRNEPLMKSVVQPRAEP
jgi:hypothetical protein